MPFSTIRFEISSSPVRAERDRHGRVDARQLLNRERISQRVGAAAAVLLRERDAHEVELAELADDLVGEGLGPVELLRDRRDFAFREVAHGALDQLVVVREVEVHRRDSS